METYELVELAALLSLHGPAFVAASRRISQTSLEQYWTASKCRMDRWGLVLKRFSSAPESFAPQPAPRPPFGALEEILAGEVLTRVWTAVLCALDSKLCREEAAPVARSILIGHMESRNRVLSLIARGRRIKTEEAVRLNRLRRRAERWTDLLIARLAPAGDVCAFASDPDRALELAAEMRPNYATAWPVLTASMRAAFRTSLSAPSPNRDLNTRIAASILACFDGDLFETTGLPRTLWVTRLLNTTADTQGMIDELFQLESPAATRPGTQPAIGSRHTPGPGFVRRRRREW